MKVRFLLLSLAALVAVTLFASANQTTSQTKQSASGLPQAESDLFNEINQARAQPAVYASYLEKMKPLFNGKEYKPSGQEAYSTQEGWSAVEDAIKFLRAAKPQAPLTISPGLCAAAMAHVKEQSATGTTGHKGNDSTLIEDRVKPFGTWQGAIGETLMYGNMSARERVLTWLIDDGVANRGHRNRIMSESYRVAGVSCGPHPDYGSMCSLALAGGFIESKPATTTSTNKNANTNTNSKPKNTNTRTSTKP